MGVFCLADSGGPLSGKKDSDFFKICQQDHTPFVIISKNVSHVQKSHPLINMCNTTHVCHLKCSYNDSHLYILSHNHLYDLSTLE